MESEMLVILFLSWLVVDSRYRRRWPYRPLASPLCNVGGRPFLYQKSKSCIISQCISRLLIQSPLSPQRGGIF